MKACMLSSLLDHCKVHGFTCVPLQQEVRGGRKRAEPKSVANSTCHLCQSEVQVFICWSFLKQIVLLYFSQNVLSVQFQQMRIFASFRLDIEGKDHHSTVCHGHDPTHQDMSFTKMLETFTLISTALIAYCLTMATGKLVSAHTPEFNFFEKCLCGETSCHW